MTDDGYAGLGPDFAKAAILALMSADVMDDIRSAILANAENPNRGIKIFNEEFAKVENSFSRNSEKLYLLLENFAEKIQREIPLF